MKKLLYLFSGILLLSALSCREMDDEVIAPTTISNADSTIETTDGDPVHPPRR